MSLVEPEPKDRPHPTASGRTLLKDLDQKLKNYHDRRARMGLEGSADIDDMSDIFSSVKEEYLGKPKDPNPNSGRRTSRVPKVTPTKQVEKFEPFYENERNE